MILLPSLLIFFDFLVSTLRYLKNKFAKSDILKYIHFLIIFELMVAGIVLLQFYEPLIIKNSFFHIDIGLLLITGALVSFCLNLFKSEISYFFGTFIKLISFLSLSSPHILIQLTVINFILLYILSTLNNQNFKIKRFITELLLVLSWIFIPGGNPEEFGSGGIVYFLIALNILFGFLTTHCQKIINFSFLTIPLFISNFQIISIWKVGRCTEAMWNLIGISFILVFMWLLKENLRKRVCFSFIFLSFFLSLSSLFINIKIFSLNFFFLLLSLTMLKGYLNLLKNKDSGHSILNRSINILFIISPGFPLYYLLSNLFALSQLEFKIIVILGNFLVGTILFYQFRDLIKVKNEIKLFLNSKFSLHTSLFLMGFLGFLYLKKQYNPHIKELEIYQLNWIFNDFLISLSSLLFGILISYLLKNRLNQYFNKEKLNIYCTSLEESLGKIFSRQSKFFKNHPLNNVYVGQRIYVNFIGDLAKNSRFILIIFLGILVTALCNIFLRFPL